MKNKIISTIVAFTVLLFSGFIHGAIPASERAALIELYNSTNRDYWCSRSGWKTPPLRAWLDTHAPNWEIYQDQCGIPEIALNRTRLNFGEYDSTIALPEQTV